MIFKINPCDSTTCFIYGFPDLETKVYDFVLTIKIVGNKAEIHAMLNRGPELKPWDWSKLWTILKEASPTELFEFEVLPGHAMAYRMGFEQLESIKTKTFDGFDSEIIRIHRDVKFKSVFRRLIERMGFVP